MDQFVSFPVTQFNAHAPLNNLFNIRLLNGYFDLPN
jgi:hypothetical protein